ncbi:MAG: heparinase II/III family protein [Victivallales bacterium]|nr:heparinase II/III family protein [Victivallales bacterium]
MKNTPPPLSNTYPPLSQTRIRELEEMLPEKPQGIAPPASNRVPWDKLAATDEGHAIINAAVPLLNENFPALPDDLYLQFSRNGNRTNYEAVFGRRNSWIITLALAECLEYQGRFLPKMEEFLEQFLTQKSWVLPAHDPRLAVFNGTTLYPDLTGSSVTAMIAYIDWFLQDKLKPQTRLKIRQEVYRRSITPWQNIYRSGQFTDDLIWMKWMNSPFNWNPVCTCHMLSASLILMDSRHDRAEALAAMETSNSYFYRGFTSDGYCSEGLGYWSYGFGHFLTMGEIVFASTNGRLNIFDDDPIIPKCCEYARNIMIEDGVAPAYADCGFKASPGDYNLAIIQRHFPELLLKPVQKPILTVSPIYPISLLNFIIFAFTDGKSVDSKHTPPIPPVSFFDQAGILICRSKDKKGNTFGSAIKGGHNGEAHNHNDVGSYLIVANKSPLVCDPGGEIYSRRTFGPERYTSKVLNSYGHDVPVVAGHLQRTGADAKGIVLEPVFTDETSSILIDMTSCYDVKELVSLTRRFTFDRVNRKIIITDNVEFTTPQTFEDAIVTSVSYRINSSSQVQLYDQNASVTAGISVTGADWTLEQEYIENPNRISPTRFGIKLSKPVLKATVVCVYTSAPTI